MQERSRKIAKNTMFLYIRTFIALVVGLFTGRVLLEALGIDNYGIYNVVGGIVSFSTLITGAMSAATSRYITYALGENNPNRTEIVFSTVIRITFIIGLITVIFLEIIGLWFLNTTADIPDGRMFAANCVLQCSIAITFISINAVPFNATIIAHEQMSFYAYISILDALLKLGICFLLMAYGGDRLIFYAIMLVISQFITAICYGVYAKSKFNEVKFQGAIDRTLVKELAGFSGWSLLNNTTWIFSTQGVNMLINVFFGVAYNAARGVCVTVNSCIQAFVGNLLYSISPQIIKSYANKEYDYCFSLANRGMKITWFLMYLFLVPVCIEAHTLLHLWLIDVPPMAVLFLQFTMFETLALKSGQILQTLIEANGNIRRYTIEATLYTSIVFPATWICYYFKSPVWIAYVIFIFIYFTLNIVKIVNLKRLMPYHWQSYVSDVLKPCLKVSVASFVIPILITLFWEPSLLRFFVMVPVCLISTACSILFLGFTPTERTYVWSRLQSILSISKISHDRA